MMPSSPTFEYWSPVTHDFGLIQAPLTQVVERYQHWHRGLGVGYRLREITTGISAALASLAPLSAALQRKLFVQTDSDWTAFFQNGIRGSDPFPPMSYLSHQMRAQAMRVCWSASGDVFLATIWELYVPTETLAGPESVRRSVCASNDGGRWVFDACGEPFSFERVEAYQAKRKRDRFTNEMLAEYLTHFGIRLFDDSFFLVDSTRQALLLDQIAMPGGKPGDFSWAKQFSLVEVKQGVPWQR